MPSPTHDRVTALIDREWQNARTPEERAKVQQIVNRANADPDYFRRLGSDPVLGSIGLLPGLALGAASLVSGLGVPIGIGMGLYGAGQLAEGTSRYLDDIPGAGGQILEGAAELAVPALGKGFNLYKGAKKAAEQAAESTARWKKERPRILRSLSLRSDEPAVIDALREIGDLDDPAVDYASTALMRGLGANKPTIQGFNRRAPIGQQGRNLRDEAVDRAAGKGSPGLENAIPGIFDDWRPQSVGGRPDPSRMGASARDIQRTIDNLRGASSSLEQADAQRALASQGGFTSTIPNAAPKRNLRAAAAFRRMSTEQLQHYVSTGEMPPGIPRALDAPTTKAGRMQQIFGLDELIPTQDFNPMGGRAVIERSGITPRALPKGTGPTEILRSGYRTGDFQTDLGSDYHQATRATQKGRERLLRIGQEMAGTQARPGNPFRGVQNALNRLFRWAVQDTKSTRELLAKFEGTEGYDPVAFQPWKILDEEFLDLTLGMGGKASKAQARRQQKYYQHKKFAQTVAPQREFLKQIMSPFSDEAYEGILDGNTINAGPMRRWLQDEDLIAEADLLTMADDDVVLYSLSTLGHQVGELARLIQGHPANSRHINRATKIIKNPTEEQIGRGVEAGKPGWDWASYLPKVGALWDLEDISTDAGGPTIGRVFANPLSIPDEFLGRFKDKAGNLDTTRAREAIRAFMEAKAAMGAVLMALTMGSMMNEVEGGARDALGQSAAMGI